ncbi:MAG: IS1595 family transposase [Chloroflexi bacterium]|nr:IS1595 family transposase [Chloroflexota bacterium]
MATPKTLLEAIRHFSDPDTCLDYMVKLRWPDGVTCPSCQSKDVRFISTRRLWECKTKHAKRQFSVKVGTIFEDSPIGLDKWLAAIWMIANAKNGVSSYEIARSLGVTQKTAWFMLHRIRLAMEGDTGIFGGRVEVDETFIGGQARFMHKSRREKVIKGATGMVGKVAVMGLLARHGKDGYSTVKAKMIADVKRQTLQPMVRHHIEPGSEVITDDWTGYKGINTEYVHNIINHAEAYVKGHVHTNGVENFWSLLKRAIRGTYVSVEPFHLFRYLDEEVFRYNTRGDKDGGRSRQVAGRIAGKRLTYAQLTGAPSPLPNTTPA